MRVGIVAGEASGDYLAAELIKAIRRRVPDATFEGVAGPRMTQAGCRALFSADKLSLVGLVEVIRRLPDLLLLRRRLVRYFRRHPPDVFVGIDVPDFNLRLERHLKDAGIRTVHYVGPQVWAWRQRRVQAMRRSVDLMLTLFPFEADFYREHGVAVRFVGHPLADEIPEVVDRGRARERLDLVRESPTVALLPGSRTGELRRLAEPFARTAHWLAAQRPDMQFVAPMTSRATRATFERALQRWAPQVSVRVLAGQAREAIAAADVVLAASGTATLESVLVKRPVVVAYRLAPVTYWFVRRMVRLNHYALPNLLAGRTVAPELMQSACTPENLGTAVLRFFDHPEEGARLEALFADIQRSLRCQASERAAQAIVELVAEDPRAGGLDGRAADER